MFQTCLEEEIHAFLDKIKEVSAEKESLLSIVMERISSNQIIKDGLENLRAPVYAFNSIYFNDTMVFLYEDRLEKSRDEFELVIKNSGGDPKKPVHPKDDPVIDLMVYILKDEQIFQYTSGDHITNMADQIIDKINFVLYLHFKTINEGLLNFRTPDNNNKNDHTFIFLTGEFLH